MAITATPAVGRSTPATILRTTREADLDQIRLSHVQAVICVPEALPQWFDDVAAAVRGGLVGPCRATLDAASAAEIAAWLESGVLAGAMAAAVRAALTRDVLALVDRLGALTDASRFLVRAVASAPTRHCGFHVDTVPPGAPSWGLLRVYNGPGTDYVEPANVTTMREVYRYMSRRERLARQLAEAETEGDRQAGERLLGEIIRLDHERAFLRDTTAVCTAPAGSIVAFKHLDVQLHWSDHPPGLAWLHCSPMHGEPRFLVNVTARAPRAGRSARPAPGATAP